MCVILVCPNNVRPDLKTLQTCYKANPHGAGIAWREGGGVRWLKTNDLAEIHRLAQAKTGEVIIHFRIASVGGACDALRHPFPVSKQAGLDSQGKAKAVLFQNGTWTGYAQALEDAARKGHTIPEGKMSDARAAAFLCSICGEKFLEDCAPSRWVFFSSKATSTFGKWHKIDGILYSNTLWRKTAPKPAQAAPKPAGPIPANTPKCGGSKAEPMELWDMSWAARYWDHLFRATPKPQKANN